MIRVLLVDDDAMYRRIFTLLLGGLQDVRVVAEAASLEEARTMLEGVDVAILDRMLPDGDGLELIGELRNASPGESIGDECVRGAGERAGGSRGWSRPSVGQGGASR